VEGSSNVATQAAVSQPHWSVTVTTTVRTGRMKTAVSIIPIVAYTVCKKGKGSPYSITERRVPELIPVLGS